MSNIESYIVLMVVATICFAIVMLLSYLVRPEKPEPTTMDIIEANKEDREFLAMILDAIEIDIENCIDEDKRNALIKRRNKIREQL